MAGRVLLHLRSAPGPAAAAADAFCARITPRWEAVAGGLLLDLTGTARLYGRGLDGLARVCREARRCFDLPAAGAGGSPLCARLAAWTAARVAPGCVLTVPAGSASAFLARFPLEVLDAQPTAVGRLRELGVRTLGDLQAVPRPCCRRCSAPWDRPWRRRPAVAAGAARAPAARPRRRGLVGLDLLTDGGPGRHPGQGRLFAADAAADRLAAALRRTRGRPGGGLGPASEALLRPWRVRWLEAQPVPQAPVDAPGPDR